MKLAVFLTLYLSVSFAAFSQDALYIDPEGNVGIGTNTPQEKLDVDGQVLAHNTIIEMGENANGYYVKWANGLLQCWITDFHIQGTLFSEYDHHFSDTQTWVYPHPFAEGIPPMVTGSVAHQVPIALSGWIGFHYDALLPESTNFRVGFHYPYTDEVLYATIYAIGFWKQPDFAAGMN